MGKSAAFRRFLDSFRAPITSFEFQASYDLDALGQIQGEEREEAEEMLLKRLKSSQDARATIALAHIDSLRAVPVLRKELPRLEGEPAVEAAQALYQLVGDDPLEVFRRELSSENPRARAGAAFYLRSLPLPRVETLLFDCFEDPDGAVRRTAFDSLLDLYGLKRHADQKIHGRLAQMRLLMRSSLESVRHQVIRSLIDIRDELVADKRPKELGLTREPRMTSKTAEALTDSIHFGRQSGEWADDIDLEALDEADDDLREWAEAVLLRALDEGDYRAPRALAHMDSTRAVEPLQEVLPDSDGRLFVETAVALKRLANDDAGLEHLRELADADGPDSERARAALDRWWPDA